MMSNSIQKWGRNSQNSVSRFQHAPNGNQSFQAEENGFHPRKLIALLIRYKWIILLFVLGGAIGAWFYADTVTPVYESNGALIISSGDNSATDELSRIISQTTGHRTNSTLENELQVLESRSFSHQVAETLMKDSGSVGQYPIMWSETEDGSLERASVEQVAGRIRNNVSFFRAVEESDVIEVSFQSTSAQEASKIVNLTMQNYIESSTRQNREAANSTAEFLAKEEQKIKKKLQETEQELRSYMDATGIVQVNEQANGMVNQRADTEVELQRVRTELKAVKESISDYENRLDRIKPGLSDQLTEAVGPRIQSSQELLTNYEQERALIVSQNPGVLEEDPVPARIQYLDKEIKRLKKEIKNLSSKLYSSDNEFMGMNSGERAQMVSEIQRQLVGLRIERNQLEAREKAMETSKNEMDADFNSLPQRMIKLAKLRRDVRINEELYVNVSRQHSDMSVWRQAQSGFGRIIDPGNTPNAPVSPNRMIYLLLGLMLGGVLAAGFIAVKEFQDNTVSEVGQLQSVHFPPLTVVPEIEKASHSKSFTNGEDEIAREMVLLQDRESIVSEAIRRLKNNIVYQNGDHPPKTIVVTSPEKGDGKSTISSNLSLAFAQEGYKTLLIDSDFRRPKIHKYFKLQGTSGLSNYLNNEISFKNLLKGTDLKTLDVIPAGFNNDTPGLLSNNVLFKQLLKRLEDTYDVIIIDTAPYGIISDSTALIKNAEATLVVAKHKKTNNGMLFRTMQELRQINANVISIVLNSFDHKKDYGKHYGEGYYQALYSNYDEYI